MTPTEDFSPTDELYDELKAAYQYFNHELFGSTLPGCLFTLQRKLHTYGYYSPSRFLKRDASNKTDEIALNPAFFAFRSVDETLSTLAHEMAHQWQIHFGNPSRNGYHNREWSDKMESIGLMPSQTGAPGGKRVGQQMTHYILENGAFQQVCNALLESKGMISWIDKIAQNVSRVTLTSPGQDEELTGKSEGTTPDIDIPALTALGLSTPVPGEDKKTKIKYTCPGCGINVWGKAELKIGCLECDLPLNQI